ncbi:hypothetical protein ABW20_dc0107490 [Dactylellina cionopaga]|nr:hypothetical protein ABW20_dc0107490 [Dactylellina cionopaga]
MNKSAEIPTSLTEPQDLKLRFAAYKLKRDGLIETVEFVRLKCLQSLLPMFEEINVNKMIKRVKALSAKLVKTSMDKWRIEYIELRADATSPTGASNGTSNGNGYRNPIEPDKYTISFITILHLAALWDKNKYQWYAEGFEPSGFYAMMAKRCRAFEH